MDPYIGEIRLWPGSWAPQGWFFCQGQTLPIQSYTPLFAIIGNYFGGDGRTNFMLPNLGNHVVMGQGQGPGLTSRQYAAMGGSTTVTLLVTQLAAHNHMINCQAALTTSVASETVQLANGAVVGRGSTTKLYDAVPDGITSMNASAIGAQGAGLPHNNLQPTLALNFMIAWDGVWPEKP
jgi:microcystin-dependent protein